MILQMNLFFRAIGVYIICMDNKTLLLTIPFLLAACAEESTGPHYTTLYDELEHEVSLTGKRVKAVENTTFVCLFTGKFVFLQVETAYS